MAQQPVKKDAVAVEEKKHFFPMLSILIGILLLVVAIVQFMKWWQPSLRISTILLALGGLVIIWLGTAMGYEHKRKDLLKKYI
jgi:uncharacterized membrane protein